ncbi:hypothetical protein [Olivibacter domesticus]|uniref:hypothetical protein n=1 Tax=Olivibacter domesticus TaxID=407022 RepID=UPI000B84D8B7|nr:hypothetical protein [Olivibacter domesticus]
MSVKKIRLAGQAKVLCEKAKGRNCEWGGSAEQRDGNRIFSENWIALIYSLLFIFKGVHELITAFFGLLNFYQEKLIKKKVR